MANEKEDDSKKPRENPIQKVGRSFQFLNKAAFIILLIAIVISVIHRN